MNIAAALVLFAVVWFLCLFVVLPLRLRTQGESGKVVRGTPASAPASLNLRRKALVVTVAAFLIWAPLCAVIASGLVSAEDIDFFRRFREGS